MKKSFLKFKYVYLSLFFVLSGCYSFKGTSIPANVTTFMLQNFEVQALNAPPDIDQGFSEALRDKIRSQSRLNQVNVNGDVEFSGSITEYSIQPVAAREGEAAELTRLQISVSVNYVSWVNEEDKWTNKFSRFAEFDSSTDFSSAQESLTEEIYEQIMEDIFNKAFNNW